MVTGNENVYLQEEKYIEFEDLYNETLVKVETMIETYEKKETRSTLPIPLSSSVANQSSGQTIIVNNHSYRTPLPTFDGRYEAWPRFKAMFQDLMQRSNDSDAVKLYHLETSLRGEAEGVIDIETLQNNNYERAWEILEERFGNQRQIIESHILGLLNMKRISKRSSKELRSVVDECSRHVDNLTKLDQQFTGISQLFVVTLLTRVLDDQTRELWEASINQSKLPEYALMIKFLKQRCVILERCENDSSSRATTTTTKVQNPKFVPSKGKFYNSHVVTTSPRYVCDFCSGSHQSFKCPAFLKMTIAQRQGKLKSNSLCFNCLRKGHHSTSCHSDKSCRKCSKKHHTLIHFEKKGKLATRASEAITKDLPKSSNLAICNGLEACSQRFTNKREVIEPIHPRPMPIQIPIDVDPMPMTLLIPPGVHHTPKLVPIRSEEPPVIKQLSRTSFFLPLSQSSQCITDSRPVHQRFHCVTKSRSETTGRTFNQSLEFDSKGGQYVRDERFQEQGCFTNHSHQCDYDHFGSTSTLATVMRQMAPSLIKGENLTEESHSHFGLQRTKNEALKK